MRPLSPLLAAATLAAASLVAALPAAAAPAVAPGTFVPVTPFRVVDTRTGAMHNHKGALGAARGMSPTIGGKNGVPTKVAAVAVTITAVAPTSAGGLVAYQPGRTRPSVRNLIYAKARNNSVAAIVRTSSSGAISLFNAAASGHVDVVVDVSGYYAAGTPSSTDPGVLTTVPPMRISSLAVAAGRTTTVSAGGHAGVPASGVGAVAVMLNGLNVTKAGTLTAYPLGTTRPGASAVHLVPGPGYAQFLIVPTDYKGRLVVYNGSAAAVHVAVDVVGWFARGAVTTPNAYQPRSTARVLNGATMGANSSRSVPVVGHGGVPSTGVAAVAVSLTATAPKARGGLVAWKSGSTAPGVTNLQFAAGQAVSDTALVPVSSTGAIGVRNVSSGATKVYVDIVGYVPSTATTVPPTSVGRYVRNVTATGGSDLTTMHGEGCSDAGSTSSRLVLLELGAQSITAPLSIKNPGVTLTAQSDPAHRIPYSRLRDLMKAYLTGFAGCTSRSATVALGTNNDGAFTGKNAYLATWRGTDWAREVIVPLRQAAAANYPHLSVVAANDIESGSFSGDEQQAEDWETSFLKVPNTGNAVGTLIYNGSADGCPTAAGATGRACANGWTQADYYYLAHGIDPSRLRVLPQLYNSAQIAQWVNIEQTGGNGLNYAGVLTEYAACPIASDAAGCPTASMKPASAWSAVRRARSPLAVYLAVPAATDLQVDSGP